MLKNTTKESAPEFPRAILRDERKRSLTNMYFSAYDINGAIGKGSRGLIGRFQAAVGRNDSATACLEKNIATKKRAGIFFVESRRIGIRRRAIVQSGNGIGQKQPPRVPMVA
jgi:hypothetical protein